MVAGYPHLLPIEAAGPLPAGPARLLLRPEWGRLGGPLPGRVVAVRYRGADTDYRLDTPLGSVEVRERGIPRTEVGAAPGWALSHAWLLDGNVSRGSAPDRSAPVGR